MPKRRSTSQQSRRSDEPALPRPRIVVAPAKAGYPKDGGELDLLVTIGVDLPDVEVDRKPLALALVVDRSGSMNGAPLECAKAAACAAVEMLLPEDWVSVVTFESGVQVPVPLRQVGSDRAGMLAAVKAIMSGGSTALYAGWAEGLSQALACPDAEAVSRVVLLSDGNANVGVQDAPSISADVAGATVHGVTTTAMGFGGHYDEALLRSMADAGQGNYVFIEDDTQLVDAFQHELAGLSSLRGRKVTLSASAGVTLELIGDAYHARAAAPSAHATPAEASAQAPSQAGFSRLPDLVAGFDREQVLRARFAAGVQAPTFTLAWEDLITGGQESLRVPLGIEPVDAETFDELPTDQSVATYVSLARIAKLKLGFAEGMRLHDLAAAARLLTEMEAAVKLLPEGDERSAEDRELRRLRELVERREYQFASRTSEKFARDRMYGASDEKRMAMYRLERELQYKKAAVAEAPTPGYMPRSDGLDRPLAVRSLPRPDGGATVVQVIKGDVTRQRVDAIVNSTNRQMFGNSGVDGAVHRRGGKDLTLAARELRGLDYGRAAFTPGFALPARYVVHTVAMPWRGGADGELDVLARAFRSAYDVASQLGARTLAVPAVGTGSYRIPEGPAAQVAIQTLVQAIERGAAFEGVRFVLIDDYIASAFVEALLRAAVSTSAQVN